MPRKYRHVKEYENEILELREKGLARQEIADKLGMEKVQIKSFINRSHIYLYGGRLPNTLRLFSLSFC